MPANQCQNNGGTPRSSRHYFRPASSLSSSQLRLAQLLLSEEGEEATTDCQLRDQANPEPRLGDSGRDSHCEIREYVTRSGVVGCKGTRTHGDNGTNNLGRDECECNVETRQSLQKQHAETHTLDRV